jgi:hypothetical protein
MKEILKTSEIKEGYYRVTHVLEPMSKLNLVPQHILEARLENKQNLGKLVHECCEYIVDEKITGDYFGLPKEAEGVSGYISSFLRWAENKNGWKRPQRFYCSNLMLTGMPDGLYKNETGYTIYDLKIPVATSKTWKYQGAAYAYLAMQAGYNITQVEFVRLKKDGKKPISNFYDDFKDDFKTYLDCLKLYKIFFPITKKKEETEVFI